MPDRNKFWRPLRYVFVTWLLAGLWFSAAAGVPVADLPPRPHPAHFVNDLAGVLRPEQVQALERKLRAYQDSTSTQLVVVLVHSTGAYEVANYAQQLGVAWGVGQKGKNNGLVMLAAIDQHRMAIETGYGLEATITDALTNDIMREQLQPNFRRGDYYAGLNAGVDVLMQRAKGEFKAEPNNAAKRGSVPWWFWLLAGGIGLVVLAALFYGAWRALAGSGRKQQKGSPALAKGSRRGATRRKSARPAATDSAFFSSSSSDLDSSSDSSSDSSDFGGGDFGGGGSSSDW